MVLMHPLNRMKTIKMYVIIHQTDQSQGPVPKLRSRMRVDQAQRQNLREQNYFGLTIRPILVPLRPSLCTRYIYIPVVDVGSYLCFS